MQSKCECVGEFLKELHGLDLECCEREEIGELMRESKSGAHICEDASRVG